MDSIVKLLLALIIGYCFVKLFCGCSVEGISRGQIIEKGKALVEEGEELLKETKEKGKALVEEGEELLKEKYNPTQLGSVRGCGKGKYLKKSPNPFDWSCLDCPVGKYSNEDNYSHECKSCPAGSVPVLDSGVQGSTGSTGCQYCGQNDHQTRYSDGIRCQNCPANSKINCNVLKTQSSETPVYDYNKVGRSINDCICNDGYIKNTLSGGGFECIKCPNGTYPNKQANKSPDECVKLGSDDCPKESFSFYCNVPDGEVWDGPRGAGVQACYI
jgi:hypothetical protein